MIYNFIENMSTERFIENLKESLTLMQNYSSEMRKLSEDISNILTKNGGRIFIIAAGSTATMANSLIESLEYHFKFDKNKIEMIFAGIFSNFDFQDKNQTIEKENNFAIGTFAAIEKNLSEDDLVIALSSTGRTDYINGFIEEAKIKKSIVAYITSPEKHEDQKDISNVDYLFPFVLKTKNISGLYIGNHTTLLKVSLEKIFFTTFENMGQINDNAVLTTRAWTTKLKENSIPVIKKYNNNLTKKEIDKLFEESNNELSTIIASIILKTNLLDAKKRIEDVKFDFRLLK